MEKKDKSGGGNERYILSSVDSALQILNLFLQDAQLSGTEIAKKMGISRSTAFRFLVTLENRGFLFRSESGKYRLGISIFSLGMMAHSRNELALILHPYLEKMVEETGETCHLVVREGAADVVFLDRVLGTNSLRMDTPLGHKVKLHNTGTGKAILAFSQAEAINDYIRHTDFHKETGRSIGSAQELLAVLEKARADGYAMDNEESEPGLTCIARPLLDSHGTAYAAVSVSGPTTRMIMKKDQILSALKRIIKQIHYDSVDQV